ncbi:MAG: hypothetical protein DIZ80_16125 [endosymbiont of Galathealinum brachiosum]|uniref:TssC1 N-terminal domain-containing protein n=1 Tax=endosymbiont of Galathealinum brachiosum TaxID=2200906 RepID=A0A370D9M7_9GAMM|nr:MAG: hypothetical protein DIZ80_16125 [endosymbiont of Galathealinum brachiosum]
MSDKPTMGVEVNVRSNGTPELKTAHSKGPETQANTPFCIAILGDFSGGLKNTSDLKNKRRLIEIDRDNLEEVMADFKINLNLNLSDSETINIALNELDDFHPDELYEKLESFSKLRSLRRRLKSKNNFADAAAEIQGWIPYIKQTQATTVEKTSSDNSPDSAINSDNLLDDILGSHQEQSGNNTATEATHIDKLIKSIVAPYVEAATDPRQDDMISMVDKATESHMRDILHHPDFQSMESAWLSLYFLIKRIETGSKLKLFILDITKKELQNDLAVDDISTSGVYKLFCDPAEGDAPWSVLLGNYSFTDSIEDVLSLVNIGAIAQQTNAPFIAAANEHLACCESFSKTPDYEDWNHIISEGTRKAWEMLRQSPVASYIGLALPRFLLRLPYGKKSKPIDTFTFEELTDENDHESYLWGNAAFIKTECLARNFYNNHWNMRLTEVFQTDNLPVHYFQDDGETVNKPVAEIMLTEKGGEILNDNGLISLWSVRNMDCIRSTDYRSIHKNSLNISGRWD